MTTTSTHRGNDDRGFTLIELMVVVLIIAILLAIAIPTFLGAQNKAKDRSAQSSARNALTMAKTLYADAATYTDADAAALQSSEPSLTFHNITDATTDSDGPKVVSVDASDDMVWYAAVKSATGTCFYIKDTVDLNNSPAGTTYAKDSADPCVATDAPTGGYSADGWK